MALTVSSALELMTQKHRQDSYEFDRSMIFNSGADIRAVRPHVMFFLEQLIWSNAIFKDFSLVDLGCGRGDMGYWVAERYSKASIYGVDLFQQFDHEDVLDNLSYHVGNMVDLLVLGWQADVCVMINMFHSPGVFKAEDADLFMKTIENQILIKFRYFITSPNRQQYISWLDGKAHYCDRPVVVESICGRNPAEPDIPEYVLVRSA